MSNDSKQVYASDVVKLSDLPDAQYISPDAQFLITQDGQSNKLSFNSILGNIKNRINELYNPIFKEIDQKYDNLVSEQKKDFNSIKAKCNKLSSTINNNISADLNQMKNSFQKFNTIFNDKTNELNQELINLNSIKNNLTGIDNRFKSVYEYIEKNIEKDIDASYDKINEEQNFSSKSNANDDVKQQYISTQLKMQEKTILQISLSNIVELSEKDQQFVDFKLSIDNSYKPFQLNDIQAISSDNIDIDLKTINIGIRYIESDTNAKIQILNNVKNGKVVFNANVLAIRI